MKIGILTFHNSRNYGAVLQCYSLMKYLKEKGFQAEVMAHQCLKINDELSLWIPEKNIIKSVARFVFRLRKKIIFEKFIKNKLILTKDECDAVIVGSDQVWNEKITGNDKTFFLDGYGEHTRKIAYATSAGDDIDINNENLKRISRFNHVSVREESLKRYLNERGLTADICCDPVMLTNVENLASQRNFKGKYVFLYSICNDNKLKAIAKTYAQRHGLVLISNKNDFRFFNHCKVEDYLSWIKNAQCVITDSFHTSVFSLKFHVPFVVNEINGDGVKNLRVTEFLHGVGAEQCLINSDEEITIPEIDFSFADKQMEKEKATSEKWLHQTLTGVAIAEKEKCFGCGSCSSICPTKSISMVEDEEGFKYPKINGKSCINCSKCLKVCQVFQLNNFKSSGIKDIYAVKHKNENTRLKSMSGGAFTAISDYALNQDGVVYGCILENSKKAIHVRAKTVQKRDEMRGSKYIESDLADAFVSIKEDLNSDRYVIFSGTPCQTAGLKYFLEREYDNLLCVDFICHGVASTRVWSDYVNWQELKNNGKCDKAVFRDKEKFGWHSHVETLKFNCGGQKEEKIISRDIFKKLYYSHNILRPSCYTCPYKKGEHHSDITMADYWGIEKILPNFGDEFGVSRLNLNTKKGQDLFEKIEEDLITHKIKIYEDDKIKAVEVRGKKTSREQFWKDYKAKNFNFMIVKYVKCRGIVKISDTIRKFDVK